MGDLTAALCMLLTRAHFAGVPTTRALWSHVSFALDAAKDELSPEDLERRVLRASLKHPLNGTAPRDPKQITDVLRWLIEAWRERNWPVPQVLVSGILEEATECPELCYKTYVGWGEGSTSLGTGGTDAEAEEVADGTPPMGVTLLESSGGIVHHTTGLTTWGGAAVLANWVTDNPHLISGRRVLELGAGVGFTSSVILTSSEGDLLPPEEYIATDCHHHVLTLLRHNLELNLREEPMEKTELEVFQSTMGKLLVSEEVQPGQILPWMPPSAHLRLSSGPPEHLTDVTDTSWQNKTKKGTRVEVLQLDWRSPCRLPDVDVILAADVVYAHHLIPPLVALIKSILSGTNSKTKNKTRRKSRGKDKKEERKEEDRKAKVDANTDGGWETAESIHNGDASRNAEVVPDRVAYIACTRRSHETMTLFLEEVSKQGLTYALVYQATLDTDTFLFLYNETHMPVKIYKLSLLVEDEAPS